MRALIVSLSFLLLADWALAQTSRTAPRKPAAAPDAKSAPSDALTSCIAMWEPSTHMSRSEWNRACRRVADRIQNLRVK